MPTRKNADLIRVLVESDGKDSPLKRCGCFQYMRDKDEIEITIPEDWPETVQSDTLIVRLES